MALKNNNGSPSAWHPSHRYDDDGNDDDDRGIDAKTLLLSQDVSQQQHKQAWCSLPWRVLRENRSRIGYSVALLLVFSAITALWRRSEFFIFCSGVGVADSVAGEITVVADLLVHRDTVSCGGSNCTDAFLFDHCDVLQHGIVKPDVGGRGERFFNVLCWFFLSPLLVRQLAVLSIVISFCFCIFPSSHSFIPLTFSNPSFLLLLLLFLLLLLQF